MLACLALVLAGSFAGRHIASWPIRLRYPGDWSSIEGMLLAEMVHLREGIPVYGPASPERFDAANYGPLYYLLGSRLIKPREPAYLRLRLLSLLGTLGCAAGCAILAFWLTRSCFAATLAPLLFLAYAFVSYHGLSARCDSLALMLSFFGFLVAYRLRNRRSLLLGIPLVLLAIFYKQQFAAAPLAILVFLVIQRRYRLAAESAALMGLGGVALLVFFHFIAFPRQAFFQHFYEYNILPLSWPRWFKAGGVFGVLLLVPLCVGLEFLRRYPNRLLSCYLGCAVTFALLPAGREGSDTNYFLESALVLSVLFAALLAKTIAEPPRATELLVLLATTLLAGQLFTPSAPKPEDFVRDRAVQDCLHRNFPPGTPALSYYAGDLLRAGLKTPISNLFQYVWLVRRGVLSDRDVVRQVELHRFGVIAVNFDLRGELDSGRPDHVFTHPLQRAILLNYQPSVSLEMPGPEKFNADDRFYVWIPRLKQEEPRGPLR